MRSPTKQIENDRRTAEQRAEPSGTIKTTTVTDEHWIGVTRFGLDFNDLEKIVINGMKSAFIRYDRRCDIIYDTLTPCFAALRAELALSPSQYPKR